MSELPTADFSRLRLRTLNTAPVNPRGSYVLYWMTSARRTRWNFGLQYAVGAAQQLGVGLVILDALRCDYPYASARLHRFIIEGMRDNAADLHGRRVCYYPYVEPVPGAGKGLLRALSAGACLVVGDDYPAFFLPRMLEAAGQMLAVPLVAVDGNGLLPMALVDKPYPTAYAFRRLLHKSLPAFLDDRPRADPLSGICLPVVRLTEKITDDWPPAQIDQLLSDGGLVDLPIDQQVAPVKICGGSQSARRQLNDFLATTLGHYLEVRNSPDLDRTSRLSPWLHFGHISVHQVFSQLAEVEGWEPGHVALKPTGQRCGWWQMSENAEAFLDQLITWRELGYNFCRQCPDYARYASLPDWARISLDQHADDFRPYIYTPEQFEQARTHDPLWNAAQRQLVAEGRIHGYLRMLWGKKILEWSPSPQVALQTMLALNDRYALDGRDPNGYSGIFWCLGRFDRAWGPERPIFGKIRYMTSENTARKHGVKDYLRRYGPLPNSQS